MKDHPILFSAPMVRAVLDGSKTQTRRIVKPPKGVDPKHWMPRQHWSGSFTALHWPSDSAVIEKMECPYGQPGDRLWVRETHRPIFGQSCGLIAVDYRADPQEKWERMRDHAGRPKWTPSIHMRREYSRILLEIVSVRVERLNDCSEADCWAEGCEGWDDDVTGGSSGYGEYAELWEAINGEGSWKENPWVWVVEFRQVATC